jgi:hypothetical protein
VSYVWDHTLGDVINSLIGAGLRIEFLHEFPYAARAKVPIYGAGGGWMVAAAAAAAWDDSVLIFAASAEARLKGVGIATATYRNPPNRGWSFLTHNII